MSQDSFYKFHTPEEIELANMSRFDLDHPSAIDMPLFASCLQDLKECKQANIPIYSFTEHQRQSETKYLYGAAIIIAEGIMALQDPALRAIYDLKIFVQCDSDLMLARRIKRDVAERGRTVEGILEQYLRYVKPAYDNFVQPTSKYADIIVPGSQNSVAIDLISTHVRRMLDNRSNSFRDRLYVSGGLGDPSHRQSENLSVLPQTPQLNGIFTILRDRTTSRGDFVFYADRLATFIAEKAMEFLPFKPKSVVTPTEAIAEGKTLGTEFVCGISIIRSGGPLERGLQRVFRDIRIGSLLIQSDDKTGEPLLLHTMLPFCLRDRETAKDTWVYLLHAQIGTGAAAFMAVRILLDHGVQQDHIIFLTFLVSRSGGVSALNKAFPGVRILCGAVDDELVEGWLPAADSDDPHEGRKVWIVEPGMGHIGDRYYL
ncbi:P-loop containing nucleoside triphosphate hydrolase protein [Sistotremastrum suecicum HHB10207 ss-3]|uniref:uridine/cytidine kinase n=1 Tax=Sistotremastrum suecicum HHB10207 ss-3 TaxID=1314776 RepID=A0A166G2S5_9AGAM|nr:P-loop containing nucleoside triphosphate hydrolase protein [Sistotremastrum suecicum HHB10207 ss-3]